MCNVLGVARSGYYGWLKNKTSKRELDKQQLQAQIKNLFSENKDAYGSPRLTIILNKNGYKCSRQRVARYMQELNLFARKVKKYRVYNEDGDKYAQDLLNKNFSTEAPNKIWTTDITYISTSEGWLYLTIFLDPFNREIVGTSMTDNMFTENTSMAALKQALARQNNPKNLIIHSDRGTQFTCKVFRNELMKLKFIQSNSYSCYANAVTETFFKTLKTELVYKYKFATRKEAMLAIFEYIEVFYNKKRIHSTLGYLSPVEFKEQKMALG